MNKEQLFEKMDYKEGDKIYIVILKDREGESRLNHGFNIYELLGIAKRIEYDMYKIFEGRIPVDVETVKRTVIIDDDDE